MEEQVKQIPVKVKITSQDFHKVYGTTAERIYEGYRNYGSKVVYIKNPTGRAGDSLLAITKDEYEVSES